MLLEFSETLSAECGDFLVVVHIIPYPKAMRRRANGWNC
jgi:hypothetical protein